MVRDSETWAQISSGRGPAECCWVVAQVIECLKAECVLAGVRLDPIDIVAGPEPGTLRSALLRCSGDGQDALLSNWVGTIQWIGRSTFRPLHRRRNWYVSVARWDPPELHGLEPKDLRYDTLRATGPGGQHVNRTESAVRATHVPTGVSAIARDERSQHINKRVALARLILRLHERNQEITEGADRQRWSQHNQLVRGNAVRIFQGLEFRQKEE
ncbi:MAG: peptide chain release factor H [Gammaproteobacteria bacterium]